MGNEISTANNSFAPYREIYNVHKSFSIMISDEIFLSCISTFMFISTVKTNPCPNISQMLKRLFFRMNSFVPCKTATSAKVLSASITN